MIKFINQKMAQSELKRKYVLFGDGSVALIRGIPKETIDEDGVKKITFNLEPRPSIMRKFQLRYPDDYDDLKNQTIKRSYYATDCLVLGESPINKKFIKLLKLLSELGYALKPMMGEGKFGELKELLQEFIQQNKYLLSVIKLTDDPQTEFQYFVFSDFNGNPTKASNLIAEFSNTIQNQQKELFSAKGKIAHAMELIKTARTEILEHLKQTKEESDIIGERRKYDILPGPEELAAEDQSY